jgi:hypothetical protein
LRNITFPALIRLTIKSRISFVYKELMKKEIKIYYLKPNNVSSVRVAKMFGSQS